MRCSLRIIKLKCISNSQWAETRGCLLLITLSFCFSVQNIKTKSMPQSPIEELMCSQKSTTGPYHEPHKSSLHRHIGKYSRNASNRARVPQTVQRPGYELDDCGSITSRGNGEIFSSSSRVNRLCFMSSLLPYGQWG
jgi:hypothetical protein